MICFESVKFKKMTNISNELISFDLKPNEINSLICTNHQISEDIFKSLIGLKKEHEGYVFIEGYDIFNKKAPEMYSIISDNIAFVTRENFQFNETINNIINQWLSLNNIVEKTIINKIIQEYRIDYFRHKTLTELTLEEYVSLISFFVKSSHKKNFIIKDFYDFIGSYNDAKYFVSKLKENFKKQDVTFFLIGFNFLELKNVNYIKLTKDSKNCKFKKYLIVEDKEFVKNKKDIFFPKGVFKFLLINNWAIILVSFLFNFALFSLAFFTSAFFGKHEQDNTIIPIYITISLLALLFFFNGYITKVIIDQNWKFVPQLLHINRRIFFTWLYLSITIIWSWQLLGILTSLIPLYLTNTMSSLIKINNNLLISFIFVEISPSILVSSLLILWYLKDIFKKEKIIL